MQTKREFSAEEMADIRAKLQAGVSVNHLSRNVYHCGDTVIRKIRIEMGIPPKGSQGRNGCTRAKREVIETAAQEWAGNAESVYDVATRYSISPSSISRVAAELGLVKLTPAPRRMDLIVGKREKAIKERDAAAEADLAQRRATLRKIREYDRVREATGAPRWDERWKRGVAGVGA